MKQEIGTRIFYGESATGVGQEFNTDTRYSDFHRYLNHLVYCLAQEKVDTSDPEFEGYPLLMSVKSVKNYMEDNIGNLQNKDLGIMHSNPVFVKQNNVLFKITVKNV